MLSNSTRWHVGEILRLLKISKMPSIPTHEALLLRADWPPYVGLGPVECELASDILKTSATNAAMYPRFTPIGNAVLHTNILVCLSSCEDM